MSCGEDRRIVWATRWTTADDDRALLNSESRHLDFRPWDGPEGRSAPAWVRWRLIRVGCSLPRSAEILDGVASCSGRRPVAELRSDLVRPPGFEPGTCGLRVRCSAVELEAPAHNRTAPGRSGLHVSRGRRVTDGALTRDLRGHIPALCQLSYGHQGASSVAQSDGGGGRAGNLARTGPCSSTG